MPRVFEQAKSNQRRLRWSLAMRISQRNVLEEHRCALAIHCTQLRKAAATLKQRTAHETEASR
ncbi:hypothetical protein LSCM4_01676 [Leishmania orientalis]|uniref:Uncharacterized protein n=1 Tax=Leishmania orientalis TaxID=2249476 RepID=A0A836GXB5_9TRYP|nr:hypothetical protein LSCM4_01676 [Leishmania orientalis]